MQLLPTHRHGCLCRDVAKAVEAVELIRQYSKNCKQYPAYKPFQVHSGYKMLLCGQGLVC